LDLLKFKNSHLSIVVKRQGFLVYGKYLGLIYTLFWKEQKSLLGKPLEDLKAEVSLAIAKLIELYDIMELFFQEKVQDLFVFFKK
jgi:hypothetical protein